MTCPNVGCASCCSCRRRCGIESGYRRWAVCRTDALNVDEEGCAALECDSNHECCPAWGWNYTKVFTFSKKTSAIINTFVQYALFSKNLWSFFERSLLVMQQTNLLFADGRNDVSCSGGDASSVDYIPRQVQFMFQTANFVLYRMTMRQCFLKVWIIYFIGGTLWLVSIFKWIMLHWHVPELHFCWDAVKIKDKKTSDGDCGKKMTL